MKTLHKNCPYPAHPLCEQLPLIEGDRLKEFRETISSVGKVTTPVVVIKSGSDIGHGRKYDGPDAILDGRHRIINALDLGIKWEEIPVRLYSFDNDDTPESLALREVKGRRHIIDNIQRALLAANFAKGITAAITAEQEAAAEAKKAAKEAKKAAAAGGTVEPEPEPEAQPEEPKGKRASHIAREQAAKEAGVSVDSVKKALSIQKHPDLVKAVENKKMSLEAANTEASRRRDVEKAQKNAEKIEGQRKGSIMLLKNTFGQNNAFVKRVVSGKIFGKPTEDPKGHKDLLTFCELSVEQQRALIPLLYNAISFKDAQAVMSEKPDDTWSVRDVINHCIANGLDKASTDFDFGGEIVSITIDKSRAKEIKTLISKV